MGLYECVHIFVYKGFYYIIYLFMAKLHSMWDISSQTGVEPAPLQEAGGLTTRLTGKSCMQGIIGIFVITVPPRAFPQRQAPGEAQWFQEAESLEERLRKSRPAPLPCQCLLELFPPLPTSGLDCDLSFALKTHHELEKSPVNGLKSLLTSPGTCHVGG